MTGDAEQIIRQQLAEHGDGARAMNAAADATGLRLADCQAILHALASGKRGQAPLRLGRAPEAPEPAKMRRRMEPRWCDICDRLLTDLPLHRRRRHPAGEAQ